MEREEIHYPVMHREVINFLEPALRKIIVDCTVGVGSCALRILPFLKEDSLYVGIDKDSNSLEIAKDRLLKYKQVILIKDDFKNLDNILKNLKINSVDGFLFDLGISSFQLDNPDRGFSFLRNGPLDMRMDRDTFLSAYDLVNNLSEIELASIFKKFGEERYSNCIAHNIVEERKKNPINTTSDLSSIILKSIPYKARYSNIHPATRVFLALRIVANRELESLELGLKKAVNFLKTGGRILVISFHSLEDRIVKHTFKYFQKEGKIKIITKKPILPQEDEVIENPRSRSAKLRVIEKL